MWHPHPRPCNKAEDSNLYDFFHSFIVFFVEIAKFVLLQKISLQGQKPETLLKISSFSEFFLKLSEVVRVFSKVLIKSNDMKANARLR